MFRFVRFVIFYLSFFYFSFSLYAEEDRYEAEIKRLEEELESLKTRVLETKKSLKVFGDMLLYGTLSGTKIQVFLKNSIPEMEIQSISVLIDGFEVATISEKGKISDISTKSTLLYEEDEVIPGSHVVDIILEGKAGRNFKKRARYVFTVEKGIASNIFADIQRSPVAKVVKGPDDMDINFRIEKVKLLAE